LGWSPATDPAALARHVDPGLWRRALTIVLDGLRLGHATPLPGTVPDSSQLARIIGG